MRARFESNIIKKHLFNKKQKLLLAVSGGIDSVVLAHLLKDSGFDFALAHCNFQLRGEDSNSDETFCRDLALKLNVVIYIQAFDTKAYCQKHKTNVQLAARKLRYDWFNTLLGLHGYNYLLTAHHANDLTETVFINLLRGTGINGLKGIPEKNEKTIRPLLNFSREEIEGYATTNGIAYRTDQSNSEDKYERNFIRLHIIPLLKKLNPQLEDVFIKNTFHFYQEAGMVQDYLENRATEMITQIPEALFIQKKKLRQEAHAESVLHHLLKGYGFNATQEKNILENVRKGALPGKVFNSPSHKLVIDRNDLVIKKINENLHHTINLTSLNELKKIPNLKLRRLNTFSMPKQYELLICEDQLIFPLTFRLKKNGDRFKPFGMKGFKLLSDFFKDEKLNAFEKENCKLLVNGNGDIIWVVGYRSDERYRVKKTDKNLIKLSFAEQARNTF